MSLQKLNQPLSSKSILRAFGLILLVIAFAVGGRFAWQKHKARPLTVAQTRQALRDYLEEHAGIGKFNPAQMNEGGSQKTATDAPHLPDEAADSKKMEKKKKKRLGPEHDQLARDFRRTVTEAADYKTIYRLIGENLALVDQLLAAHDPEQTKAALLLAAEASRAALDRAVNGWLAARIAEAYLWPNLDAVPATDKGGVDAASLLEISESAFEAAGETENLIRNYRLLIARSDRPGRADKIRVRLAKFLQEQRNFAEVLRVLHEVQDTNNSSVLRRIASVEMMLQQEKTAK